MKKVCYLFGLLILFTSCDIADSPVSVETEYTITKDVSVTVPKTSGTPSSISQSANINLKDYVSEVISSVKVSKVKFKIKDFSGDALATIESLSVKFDGKEVASLPNTTISQVASAGTYFEIDMAKLSLIQSKLNADSATNFEVSGSVLSDGVNTNFKIEVVLDLLIGVSKD